VNDRVLRVGEFGIFTESKGVDMATKLKQKSAKIALISVLCKKLRVFLWIVGFSGSENWSMLYEFLRDQRVAMITKFRQKYTKGAHILVLYTIWRHFWHARYGFRDWRI